MSFSRLQVYLNSALSRLFDLTQDFELSFIPDITNDPYFIQQQSETSLVFDIAIFTSSKRFFKFETVTSLSWTFSQLASLWNAQASFFITSMARQIQIPYERCRVSNFPVLFLKYRCLQVPHVGTLHSLRGDI